MYITVSESLLSIFQFRILYLLFFYLKITIQVILAVYLSVQNPLSSVLLSKDYDTGYLIITMWLLMLSSKVGLDRRDMWKAMRE